ncbi:unnamed protein product [Prorocentrum cordatum]|uniref:Uncharacterized protein n=1 Tax=Prorocentrum cordatum TaxID=2364126 RepID=A0ABN9V5A9_9DINO|nr:unnamed protein product [Polarella glacialis]
MAPSAAEASRLKDEGNAFFKAGEYQAAIDAYTGSLELDPSQHLCFSNRSAAYLKLGSAAEQALQDARQCVELAPAWAKGYSRQAAALQVLKRWDEAEKCCQEGVAACTSTDGEILKKMLAEVKSHRFQDTLKGTWHGTVSETLGGYDQEMEFLDERSVRVEVLGRSIVGKYWVDAGCEPVQLSIQVPMPEQPPNMPPPMPVPYIARIDENLHLCCPFMKLERPTAFEGPGYCLMKRGALSKAEESEVASLSHGEKLLQCARELVAGLPDRKLEEVTVNDGEEEAREKVVAQVKMESAMYAVQKRFGEETMKLVFTAAQGSSEDVPDALRGAKELAELGRKLQVCGILDDAGPAQPAPPPPPGPARAAERPAPPAPGPRPAAADAPPAQGAPDLPAAGDSGAKAVVVATAVCAVAAAAVALLVWRRSRK